MRRTEGKYTQLIGKSSAIQKLRRLICCAANSTVNVLISGETGTGKELVARTIHAQSKRQTAPFVPILCNTYPETLIEAELFGYEEGAFTNAKRAKPGMFELAHGGTLFLDEIGEMSQTVQVKLLRVLEHLTVTRIGGTEPTQIDPRLIAATNKDLQQLVKVVLSEKIFFTDCMFLRSKFHR